MLGMSKYDPLSGHLRWQREAELELTFAEIERILSAMLPKSAARQQWWANTTAPHTSQVQCKAGATPALTPSSSPARTVSASSACADEAVWLGLSGRPLDLLP